MGRKHRRPARGRWIFLSMWLAAAAGFTGAMAQDGVSSIAGISLTAIAGASGVVALMALLLFSALTSRRLQGSSLFNRLFVVVAVTAGFFSAVSSAIGFGLITSQESSDFFRNSVLPPAFGVFVFALAVAIWVGGAEFVRHRDWFRGIRGGFFADILFFIERAFKLFVVVPILAAILFFVSTWTTVVGIGGVDAVRHTYAFEIARLQSECAGITAYRQNDLLVLEDLRLSGEDVRRVALSESTSGSQSGARGQGPVTDYFTGIAEWYGGLESSVAELIEGDDPSGISPYAPQICQIKVEELRKLLAENAFQNYDAWAGEFEGAFDDFVAVLNRWRHDHRIERLLEQQLSSFSRANPRPDANVSAAQKSSMTRYGNDVQSALQTLIRKQKLAKPPVPIKSASELSPARGLDIFRDWIDPPPPPEEPEKVSRAQSVVDAEFVPSLSTITPRDAVLKHANIFSDIWALAISWDYAPYILMLAFLFFPSAERARGFKD